MTDNRYIECRECGARDSIEVTVVVKAEVGDGNARPSRDVLEYHDWSCRACETSTDRNELCFIGYPGITEAEKEEQRHG